MYKSFCIVLLFPFTWCAAQKTVAHKNENWLHAFTSIRLSSKIGITVDAGYRFKGLFEGTTQTLFRMGGVYYFNNNTFLTVGMAYFNSYPALNGTKDLVIPEFRPYQRLFINSTLGSLQISHRYRLEERFTRKYINEDLLDEFKYNYRFGYQLNVQIPLRGKTLEPNELFTVFYDEVFLNFGKQVVTNYFDQNRIFAGLGYQINKSSFIIAGYQHIWQQTSTPSKFNSIDCARVVYMYNFDLRKQD
ncbi:MAG TPA: DUF2490 domain-containing protein [Cytophagales bacterium]|nr:DUF2490 domain-containing protein [Cytophagales bacterium]